MEGLIIFIYFLPTILSCFIRSGSNDDKIWFFLYNLTAAWAIIPWFMMMHVVIEELSNENKMGQTEERLGSFDTRSNAHNITIEAIFEKPKVRIQPGNKCWLRKNSSINIQGFDIKCGMIYVGEKFYAQRSSPNNYYVQTEHCLINPKLPVDKSK